MGHENIIHGYIITDHTELAYNQNALAGFGYDKTWPLPAMFHLPNNSPHVPVISFAMVYYGLGDDWIEWFPRFEALLGTLHATRVSVFWEREAFDDPVSAGYFLQWEDYHNKYRDIGQNRWLRCMEFGRHHRPDPNKKYVVEDYVEL